MKDKATFEISGNFECKKDAPFDTRWRVDAYADLINEETWRNKDGNIYAYTGMCTTCKDKSGKIYQLTDVAHLTDYAYWKEIGEQKLIEIVNNLTREDTNKALSAAMGKKLNDEKLDKSAITTDIINSENKVASASSVFNVNAKKLDKSAIVNSVNSTDVTKVLSAAMGKKLNDEKLDKSAITTDIINSENKVASASSVFNVNAKKLDKSAIVNSVNSTDVTKVLSAAMGKVLNDRIMSLGSVYKYKGNKDTIEDVLAITDAKIGDVWNVIQEFIASDKKYPAGTNVACIKNTSTSVHSEANWDPLGGTVDLSGYATKTEMNSGLNGKVTKSDIVNDLTTGGANKVLSAEQGKRLNDELHTLDNTVQDVSALIPTKVSELTNDSNYTTTDNVLTKDNTTAYVPSGEYNPATKKYVDSYFNIVKISQEAHQQLILSQESKNTDADEKINIVFGSADNFRNIVTSLMTDNNLFFQISEKEIFKLNVSQVYVDTDDGAYELSFIYVYTTISDANNFSIMTKRIFIALNNAVNLFIVRDLATFGDLTTLTKKTKSEYDDIGTKDNSTMYVVTE